jgi:hypothetical protein
VTEDVVDEAGCGGFVRDASAIAQFVEHNRSVTTLEIGANDLGKAGAVAIAQAVAHNDCLTDLHMNGATDIRLRVELYRRQRIDGLFAMLRQGIWPATMARRPLRRRWRRTAR